KEAARHFVDGRSHPSLAKEGSLARPKSRQTNKRTPRNAAFLCILVSLFSLTAAGQSVLSTRALLDRYCVTCHNEKLATAGLMLDKMDLDKVRENPAVWEKVVHKLRTRAMPPEIGRALCRERV